MYTQISFCTFLFQDTWAQNTSIFFYYKKKYKVKYYWGPWPWEIYLNVDLNFKQISCITVYSLGFLTYYFSTIFWSLRDVTQLYISFVPGEQVDLDSYSLICLWAGLDNLERNMQIYFPLCRVNQGLSSLFHLLTWLSLQKQNCPWC